MIVAYWLVISLTLAASCAKQWRHCKTDLSSLSKRQTSFQNSQLYICKIILFCNVAYWLYGLKFLCWWWFWFLRPWKKYCVVCDWTVVKWQRNDKTLFYVFFCHSYLWPYRAHRAHDAQLFSTEQVICVHVFMYYKQDLQICGFSLLSK